jgi:MFS family permease
VTTVVADAVSYLLSALGLAAIGDREPRPERPASMGGRDLLDGWRHILGHPALRPLLLNAMLVNGLIMATAPLMAVLMLGRLGFAPWQYALAFGAPCVGGLAGSRLSRPLVGRFGQRRVLLASGALRACWSWGLAFVPRGAAGIALVIVVQFGLVASAAVFNPVLATLRLQLTPGDRVARTLAAWSVSTKLSIATMTALWGLLAAAAGPRAAVAAAGALMLLTPLLLPRRVQLAAPPS